MNSIIDDKFSIENEIKYGNHFVNFKYELSDFQKKSIKAVVDGDHSLVCCGTGNGKTTSGEFAIKHFTGQGKRVIYTNIIFKMNLFIVLEIILIFYNIA